MVLGFILPEEKVPTLDKGMFRNIFKFTLPINQNKQHCHSSTFNLTKGAGLITTEE